jgi:hypothetical protein
MFTSMLASTEDAKPHISWCIWHEGLSVFKPWRDDGPNPEELRAIQDIRAGMIKLQEHNVVAISLITRLNDQTLEPLVLECANEIPSAYSLRDHFRWVCYHEGWMPEFRVWSANRMFGYIRHTYREKQEHNPNARSLLAAVRDSEIKELVDSL